MTGPDTFARAVTAGQSRARRAVRRARRAGRRIERRIERSRASRIENADLPAGVAAVNRRFAARDDLVLDRRRWCVPLGERMPADVRMANFELVDAALKAAGIPAFVVRQGASARIVLAVDISQRASVMKALADTWGDEPVYIQSVASHARADGPPFPVALAPDAAGLANSRVVRVWQYHRSVTGTLVLGFKYGCEVELWSTSGRSGIVHAPRQNVAADLLTRADVELVDGRIGSRTYPTARVFTKRMLDDAAFPIDAVYTWVDGLDPAWRERMERARAAEEGREYHPGAHGDQRFIQRDELRYSLRSLAMFAPWIRHVYLVTDQQVPAWLAVDNPRITVVDHRDIFDDHSVLPVFNSNAIISRLHHIPDLGEHYVYFNDDFFLGRDLHPSHFFTASGLAKVSPSKNRRPFGTASASDEPHINLTRNIRAMLEAEFGVTVSRAIKHTPYPQLRSVHLEMEERFGPTYRQTVSSRFRHHDDIVADQLFHYYAQIVGKAVPSSLRYAYLNIGMEAELPRLESLLARRNQDVFCLNDAPEPGIPALAESCIVDFLESYYPVASEFERRNQAGVG